MSTTEELKPAQEALLRLSAGTRHAPQGSPSADEAAFNAFVDELDRLLAVRPRKPKGQGCPTAEELPRRLK